MDQSGLTIPAPPVATLPTLRKRATSVTPALMQQVFALRAEHPGWTQREIAMTAGLSRTVISAIMAGRYEVVQEGRHQVARPLMAGAPPAQQAAPAPELAPPAWLGTCYGCFWWGLHLARDKTQIILPRINTVMDCNRPVPGLLWGAKPAGESTPATASCSKHPPLTADQEAVAIPATKR